MKKISRETVYPEIKMIDIKPRIEPLDDSDFDDDTNTENKKMGRRNTEITAGGEEKIRKTRTRKSSREIIEHTFPITLNALIGCFAEIDVESVDKLSGIIVKTRELQAETMRELFGE
jgi:hypothetical protein